MKESINLFFAVDDNYCPFLSSALESIIQNAGKKDIYNIFVLHNGVSQANQQIITSQAAKHNIKFVDISPKLKELANRLAIRDYYTVTTYCRMFIPNMFPSLDKALYLDSDIVVNGNIAALYHTNLGNNLVGAIPDSAVQNTKEFILYVEKALGIKKEKYFNAGILLMNLKEMRKWNFEEKFINLLSKYTFKVAQDQDYLNVLTHGRVKYITYNWNVMPIPNNNCPSLTKDLIHYNMLWKPWIFENTLYEEDFWKYADRCPMSQQIKRISSAHNEFSRAKSLQGGNALLQLALDEAFDKNNYKNKFLSEVI